MKRFADRIFVYNRNNLYIYDSSWSILRPIESIGWNPEKKIVEPFYGNMVVDALDPYFGFGDEKTKTICDKLTDIYIDNFDSAESIEDIESFWKWSHANVIWLYDRPMCLSPCVESSFQTWKLFPKKQRTLRRAPRTFNFRATKRRIR